MSECDPSPLLLPPGHRFIRELTRPGGLERVFHTERDSGQTVVRIATGASARESVAELAVLAAVEHPGLARLIGYGMLPDGHGRWIAREWVDGSDLSTWARERDGEEIGRAVARLCPALEHLHARGFVHGDLKPSNVIVANDGRVVITDFGLARAASTQSADVSGTFFGLAPETLLGARVDARADLFAVGVLLHELLLRRRPSAREFYGRFPAFDFFDATGTERDELPEWARDVVAALVERDPSQRPASAAQVGRTLAGRLGIEDLFQGCATRLRVPFGLGRELWITRWLERRSPLEWIAAGSEDVLAARDALLLRAALRGMRVHALDMRAQLEDLRDATALDAWAVATCATFAGALLLVADEHGDAWSARAIDSLARALEQTAPSHRGVLVVIAAETAHASSVGWQLSDLPAIAGGEVSAFVRGQIAGEPERLQALATLLAEAARGSTQRLERVLERCAHDGWFVGGDERPRLKPGKLPASIAIDQISRDVDSDVARLIAALRVCGEDATLDEVAKVAELAQARLGRALDLARVDGIVTVETRAAALRLRATGAVEIDLVDEQHWRSLHARRATQLERDGAPLSARIPHTFAAGSSDASAVASECERLRDEGCAELALELCDAATRAAGETRRAPGPRIAAERALAWVALGQPERAAEALAEIPRHSALAERVLGQIAIVRHQPEAALAHFERARELDSDDGGSADLARARLFYELQRDRDVLALVDATRARAARMQQRIWANLLAVEAMSLFRVGDLERARELLTRYVADAHTAGDATREAALSINLATVERRAGDVARAIEHLESAERLYDQSGVVAGLAQARAMLGSALRDKGVFVRAQELLWNALATRERLGDSAGALAVRGMLGLTLAERGHARPAIAELERSARALRESQRQRDALLLEARADEMRARVGSNSSKPARAANESERLAEGDPRTLISLARTACLQGHLDDARDFAGRAERLAGGLGLAGLVAECLWLLRRIDGRDADNLSHATTLLEQDERAFKLLARAPFDSSLARALAAELIECGRDDRAARVLLAISARAPEGGASEAEWTQFETCFARCAVGCSEVEASALVHSLLGLPDPWPEDSATWQRRRSTPEEDEMEVVRLLEINHRLVAQEDLSTLLGTIVEQALLVSGAQRGFLILEENGEFSVDTALDSRRGGIDAPEVEFSGSVLRDALARMRPVRVSNAVDDPLLGAAPSVISLELRSILCVPFAVQQGLRGVIYVDHRLRDGAFDARAERMLSLLADQASLAIAQVRRVEEIRRLNRELSKQMARKESDLRTANAALRKASLPTPAAGLVGDSPVMQATRALIERAAQTKLAVLIAGPSGSGKELAARALHELGPRGEQAFVGENCAALPATLIEAELFGARRGAFTGAERDREGLFERAHGGTLFLDEIGELPLDLQAKLLRVLETSQLRRLGDDKLRTVDFRLVAATNRDLTREIREGRFRSDLYYRINGLTLEMPSLAEHPEDIPALVDHWLRLQSAPGIAPRKLASAVLAKLCRRPWPGNVRELFNEVARLLVLSEGDIVDPTLVREPDRENVSFVGPSGVVLPFEELERRAILHALEVSGGDKREAARMLGISRAKVYQRLKDWGEAGAATRELAPHLGEQ